MSKSLHKFYLQQALALAELGDGHVSPNPMVGAVVVKNQRLIGKGYHRQYGGPHAEIEALANCRESSEGATLYCTLEPCCHSKKQTPPCVKTIIAKKIKKVVVCSLDPNPQVAGEGMKILKSHGIEVEWGHFEAEENVLNERYRYSILNRRPFVHLKWAQTIDGFMATTEGQSQWISNPQSRLLVHDLRGRYGAVCVGGQTIRQDNPRLTVRFDLQERYPQPKRVILSSLSSLSFDHHVFQDPYRERTLVFTPGPCPDRWKAFFERQHIDCIELPGDHSGHLPLDECLEELYKRGIFSLLVEAGPRLLGQFFKERQFQKITVFMAPKLLGSGQSVLKGLHLRQLSDCGELRLGQVEALKGDLMVEYYP